MVGGVALGTCLNEKSRAYQEKKRMIMVAAIKTRRDRKTGGTAGCARSFLPQVDCPGSVTQQKTETGRWFVSIVVRGGVPFGTTGVTGEHRCLVAVIKVVSKSDGRLRVGHRKREMLTVRRKNGQNDFSIRWR